MAEECLKQAGMSLQQWKKTEILLMRREATVRIEEIGAGYSAKAKNPAIPDILASVAISVELFDGMVKFDANC